MDDVYTVEDVAYDVRGLAQGVDGLQRRLDQYEAAQNGDDALPPEIASMAEMEDEIAAYFRDTLPRFRATAAQGYAHLTTRTKELRDEVLKAKRGNGSREAPREVKQAYNDAKGVEEQYTALLKQLADLDQRAAELVGPATVAQAKADGTPLEPFNEPVDPDEHRRTAYTARDAGDDTMNGAERFDAARKTAARKQADDLGLFDDLTPREKAAGGLAAAGAAVWLYRTWRRRD